MSHFQFYYPKRLSFCPDDYENPGLGGGESSIVLLTRAPALRGHKVEVFNASWKPGEYNGVVWRGAWEINDTPTPDVLVAVRFKAAILDRKAKHNLFWMLDDRADGALAFSKTGDGSMSCLPKPLNHAIYHSKQAGYQSYFNIIIV